MSSFYIQLARCKYISYLCRLDLVSCSTVCSQVLEIDRTAAMGLKKYIESTKTTLYIGLDVLPLDDFSLCIDVFAGPKFADNTKFSLQIAS